MSTFVLKREYTLQMPTSYVDIDREEMEYVDGGFTIKNWAITGTIEAAIFLIPTLKIFKTTVLSVALLSSAARNSLVRTICSVITDITYGMYKMSENRVLGAIKAFTGFSIGSFIATKLIDPLDGSTKDQGLTLW